MGMNEPLAVLFLPWWLGRTIVRGLWSFLNLLLFLTFVTISAITGWKRD
jgi:hypothetical protein